ncbi:hypothetical protein QTP70_011116 [Hemibagrus guttatus]|uniref:Uncharacterized protein n=1 Tax=Hemibagrus guttatus TaxID=175788 RepID=A0AAE0R0W0_9TELE|nr:hypothetical protein QTP70_011116 [Hemibagrus guttatus]
MSDDLSPAGPKAPTGREGGRCGRRSPPPMRNEAERVPAMKRKKKQHILIFFKYKRHLSTTSNSQTPNSTMAKTKELSKDTRNKIVDLHQAGKTESAIGKQQALEKIISSGIAVGYWKVINEVHAISDAVQGWKTILDARDLRALRRHCITYRNAVMEITTWAQEYFQKTLSVNTIHRAIHVAG